MGSIARLTVDKATRAAAALMLLLTAMLGVPPALAGGSPFEAASVQAASAPQPQAARSGSEARFALAPERSGPDDEGKSGDGDGAVVPAAATVPLPAHSTLPPRPGAAPPAAARPLGLGFAARAPPRA